MNKDDDMTASVANISIGSIQKAEQKKIMHKFYTGELVEKIRHHKNRPECPFNKPDVTIIDSTIYNLL